MPTAASTNSGMPQMLNGGGGAHSVRYFGKTGLWSVEE